jgi:PRC-barrel domain
MSVKEQWTYEVPPAGAGASGLEDYQVETCDGEIVGKIISVLDHEGDRLLAFDTGLPPFVRERRAARWEDIIAIDHDALTVRIGFAKRELGEALELDPANQIEGGEADAVRLTDLPNDMTEVKSRATGPVDKPSYVLAIACFAGGLLLLLALALAAGSADFTWEFTLFLFPALLFASAAVVAYRAYRQPYER